MDYKRIYVAFIKDRRDKESALEGYSERHHIVPRSMGGGDEPDNLVRLTPEDHFFAHLLLAKIHGGNQWASLAAMGNLLTDWNGIHRRPVQARRKFGHIRRGLAKYFGQILSGPDGKIADKRTHVLRHVDGREVSGNRFELSERTGLSRQSISQLICGSKYTRGGWYSPIYNPLGQTREERISAANRDNAIHTLYHHDGRVWTGTRWEFRQMVGLALDWQQGCRHIGGWYHTSEEAAAHKRFKSEKGRKVAAARGDISGLSNPRADLRKYEFVHIETRERIRATRTEMRQRFGIRPGCMCALMSGRQRSVYGWSLAKSENQSRKEHSVVRAVSSHP